MVVLQHRHSIWRVDCLLQIQKYEIIMFIDMMHIVHAYCDNERSFTYLHDVVLLID